MNYLQTSITQLNVEFLLTVESLKFLCAFFNIIAVNTTEFLELFNLLYYVICGQRFLNNNK